MPVAQDTQLVSMQLSNVSMRKLAVCCLLWRICNVLLVQTAFSPDEYWQSLEVAHRLVFG